MMRYVAIIINSLHGQQVTTNSREATEISECWEMENLAATVSHCYNDMYCHLAHFQENQLRNSQECLFLANPPINIQNTFIVFL